MSSGNPTPGSPIRRHRVDRLSLSRTTGLATIRATRPGHLSGRLTHSPGPIVPRIQRSATVPHSPEQMFDLVNDVESYPRFLPWCRRARVLSSGEHEVRARIEMAKGALHRSFTTRNELEPGRRIRVRLEDGPFSRLEGDWHFDPDDSGGCRVSLDLEYEFAGRVLSAVIGPIFNQIAQTMVDSFVRRARSLYGG